VRLVPLSFGEAGFFFMGAAVNARYVFNSWLRLVGKDFRYETF
jgi:hypothetical protein